jgi:hypothetical protein
MAGPTEQLSACQPVLPKMRSLDGLAYQLTIGPYHTNPSFSLPLTIPEVYSTVPLCRGHQSNISASLTLCF